MTWKTALAGLATFAVLDFLWLGVVMRSFYRAELGPIARTAADGSLSPIWSAALPVYGLLVAGVGLFVLPRAESLGAATLWGAVMGLIVYGVYDLTNLATLKGYSLRLALVDMAWGGFVTASAAVVMRAAQRL
jgi:uncharacterized membrane protein